MNPLPAILVQIKIARIHVMLFFQSKHIFIELHICSSNFLMELQIQFQPYFQ
jgi:hypothetical protein